MTRLEESERLHQCLRDRIAAFEAARAEHGVAPRHDSLGTPETFDQLACDIARYQAKYVPGFQRLCAAQGVDPAGLARAEDIPAVPTDAFRLTRVSVFSERETTVAFQTSGTTGGQSGTHYFRTTETYDRGSSAQAARTLFADLLNPKPLCFVLGPPPEEAPQSSLTHMLGRFVRHFASNSSASEAFLLHDGKIDLATLAQVLARARARETPVVLAGAAFAFVHLLDAQSGPEERANLLLPSKSRILYTGGFKGRSREMSESDLSMHLQETFGLEQDSLMAEYGMTELSSQFYACGGTRVYTEPPWARVFPVDPETLGTSGTMGIAKIVDLLNIDSAVCVLTQDRVRREAGGFSLHGRLPGAIARGCSLALEDLLGTRS